ncbi:Dnmbp protein, partial [Sesbania bispinosa]
MTQSVLCVSKRLARHGGIGPTTGARDNIEDPKSNLHVCNDATPHDRVATDGVPGLKDHVESYVSP